MFSFIKIESFISIILYPQRYLFSSTSRSYLRCGIDEGREIVGHEEFIHQHDIPVWKALVLEQPQFWKRPMNRIFTFGIQRDFAIVVGLDAMRLPSNLRVLVTSVVELILVAIEQDRRIVPVRSWRRNGRSKLRPMQLLPGPVQLVDQILIHEQFPPEPISTALSCGLA